MEMVKVMNSAKDNGGLLPGRIVNVGRFRDKCFPEPALKDYQLRRLLIELTSQEKVKYLNSLGNEYHSDGSPVQRRNAAYYLYEMEGFKTMDGALLCGWFRLNYKVDGFQWGSYMEFQKAIVQDNKCSIGLLVFDSYKDRYYFLQRIQKATISNDDQSTPDKNGREIYIKNLIDDVFNGDEAKQSPSVELFNGGKSIKVRTELKTSKKETIFIVGDIMRKKGSDNIYNPRILTEEPTKRKYVRRRTQNLKISIN